MTIRPLIWSGIMALFATGSACGRPPADPTTFPDPAVDLTLPADAGPQTLVLAGGCFWCVEGVYEHVPGVIDVVSGYAGDSAARARYDLVGRGTTNHAEVVQITYDPTKVSFGKLLKVFFSIAHDPTQVDGQGPDLGKQYRSAVFAADAEQRRVAEAYIQQLDAAKAFAAPIATKVEPLEKFYPAEAYHQDYARLNPTDRYITQVGGPKIDKAKKYAAKVTAPAIATTTGPTTKPVP